MARLAVAVVALSVFACTPDAPDPREADVVIGDARLADVTAESISWWSEATDGDVRMVLSDQCSVGRACVVVRSGDVSGEDGLGSTQTWSDSEGNGGAWIVIRSEPEEPITLVVVAHELGHALGLEHVKSEDEVMRPGGEEPSACIGDETLSEYQRTFGKQMGGRTCR